MLLPGLFIVLFALAASSSSATPPAAGVVVVVADCRPGQPSMICMGMDARLSGRCLPPDFGRQAKASYYLSRLSNSNQWSASAGWRVGGRKNLIQALPFFIFCAPARRRRHASNPTTSNIILSTPIIFAMLRRRKKRAKVFLARIAGRTPTPATARRCTCTVANPTRCIYYSSYLSLERDKECFGKIAGVSPSLCPSSITPIDHRSHIIISSLPRTYDDE